VVQDIFLTETAYLADVILPASAFPEKTGSFTNTDRTVQMGRQAIDPPGEARQDLWIIQQIAREMGLRWQYTTCPKCSTRCAHHAQHCWHHLGAAGARACRHLSVHGKRTIRAQPVVFTEHFPRDSGKARFVPADIIPGQRAAGRRLSDGADHRPPAGTLAHRQHDAPGLGAGCDRARSGGAGASARPGRDGR
jgi:formate dehydrogenase major subunit